MDGVRAVLIDIDGVLTVSWEALPGTVDALRQVQDAGLAVRLLTNTTSHTRAEIAGLLSSAGFDVGTRSIQTAAVATAAYLAEHHRGAPCLLLNSGDIADDLAGVVLDEAAAEVVVVGGAGPEFSYEALNLAFRRLQAGAALVAMHRNRYWRTDQGLRLDSGAFVTGLEHAAAAQAVVVGKPAPEFFTAALRSVGVPATDAVMVGDDIESDILGAQHAGIVGVLVRTGKYDPDAIEATPGEPDHVLDSFADLPALLGLA